MHLSEEHISQFQLLYREHIGKEISKQEAYEKGTNLLNLVQLIYEPMSQEDCIKVEKEIIKIRARINKKSQP
jgi:hypothetical protein